MDTDDAVVLTLALWIWICMVFVKSVDVFVTLILIGLLVVMEVAGIFIKPEVRENMKPSLYFLLFVFGVIVVKKIMEVLS
jgi:hypothetical protein